MEPGGPNAQQIQYWNETAGPKWVKLQEQFDAHIAVLGEHALDRARVHAGERVLDVGCGCGTTTIELARRVGEQGSALGVDISKVMLDLARRRAAGTRARFENADAQTHAFPDESFELVFSRFGVMFFADPTAAFANLARALAPGGRLAFVCWQSLVRNPWMRVPLAAVAQQIALPAPPAADAPGPFAFADPERVRGILERAGFVAAELEPVEEQLLVGGPGGLERAVSFLLEIGPVASALQEAGDAGRERVVPAIREALAPFQTPEGVALAGAAWIVTARRA